MAEDRDNYLLLLTQHCPFAEICRNLSNLCLYLNTVSVCVPLLEQGLVPVCCLRFPYMCIYQCTPTYFSIKLDV